MLLDNYPQVRGLILDMDGVLWHESEPIGNLEQIFNQIDKMGLKVVFATNNATKSVTEYVKKLRSFNVMTKPENIITSAEATGYYLRSKFPVNSLAYVVGSDSLKDTIKDKGFRIANEEDYSDASMVIVGLDTNITHEKIKNAGLLIRSGVPFIATNNDATYPTPGGLFPGAGVVVAAVATASGKQPIVIGKPYIAMYEQAFKILSLEPIEVLGVGDRLETDIASAQAAGCLSALVLSGVSTMEEALNWWPAPDIIVEDLATLINE